MPTERKQCQHCGASILAATSDRTGGYCRPCFRRLHPPDPSESPWFGDWHSRVLGRIRERGFDTPGDFFAANPAVPFSVLAKGLGEDVAPVQLQHVHREADLPGGPRAAALDALVHFLVEHLKYGWGIGKYYTTDAITAFVSWMGSWDQPEARAIQRAFFASPPSPGWRPTAVTDEYLAGLFAREWPKERQ